MIAHGIIKARGICPNSGKTPKMRRIKPIPMTTKGERKHPMNILNPNGIWSGGESGDSDDELNIFF